jgi:hypothetical protein
MASAGPTALRGWRGGRKGLRRRGAVFDPGGRAGGLGQLHGRLSLGARLSLRLADRTDIDVNGYYAPASGARTVVLGPVGTAAQNGAAL